MRRACWLLAFALVALGVRTARAEGPGFKVSDDLALHLGIGVGAGYDSNVFYASGTPIDPVQGAFYVAVRPTFDLATLPVQRGGETPHTMDFRLHAALPMRFLASSTPDLKNHYSIGGEAGLLWSLFPFGPWTFDLFGNYTRISAPPYAIVKARFLTGQAENVNFDLGQAGLRLRFRPGGQRFETTLQYVFGVSFFENDVLAPKNLVTNDIQLRLKWNFFPKTALYINVGETTNSYLNSDQTGAPPAAYPFRAVAGLLGLITPKLSVNLNVGYGNGFTQTQTLVTEPAPGSPPPPTASYNNAIGLAELEWRPTTLTIFSLGYRHDFAQGLIGTYYDLDTAYAGLSQAIWRFVASLRFSWERRHYNGSLQADGLADNRQDDILVGHIQLDFPIRDWIAINVGDDIAKNYSNCTFVGPQGGPPCSYFRNDVWLRVSLGY